MLTQEEFSKRFRVQYSDPLFDQEGASITRLEEIAWQAYIQGRKSPRTRPAGPEFSDPDFELSVEWLATRQRLADAQAQWADPKQPARVLLICGSSRNDGTCPGEMSKTFRLLNTVKESFANTAIVTDVLDLSLLSSEYGRRIHPCKGCVSTAMPLCHWPCSCYPNYGQGQTNDWMAEIYQRWTAAHAVIIVSPVYWYQSPSPLKLMIDRLVCADGGNPDPTSTSGKDPDKAKRLELAGWPYPKHLAGRLYGLVIHGDVAGIEVTRRNLADWLDWMGLVAAGTQSALERYIGYFEPYATSHEALDTDLAVQQEARNVGQRVALSVQALRAGHFPLAELLPNPRPK